MDNANVIIVGMALLVVFIISRGRASWLLGVVSAILIVGALRHPEIAAGATVAGTPGEQLQGTMILAALIVGGPVVLWMLKR